MADELKALKAKRSYIKGSITQMMKFINSFDETTGKISDIKVRDNKIEQLYNEFMDLQASIDSLSPDESDNSFLEFEENYYQIKSKFSSILSKPSQILPSILTENSFDRPSKSHETINLPKINLPCFEGKIELWKSFFDLFESTIHNNKDLADIQKFYYLKSSLKGEPLDIILSLPLTQSNYNVALEILKERYSNKKLVVNSHLKALFSLSSTSASSSSLKQLLDTTNVNVRALKCLGYKTEEWDILLVFMLSSKLDHNLRTKWELSNTTTEPPTFSQFECFLKQHIQALEACVDHKPKFQPNNNQNRSSSVKINATEVGRKLSCPICHQAHKIFHCSEFLNLKPSDRIEKVKRLHRCFNCLSSGHTSSTCSSSKCRTCGKSHNTLLHISNVLHDSHSSQPASNENGEKVVKDSSTTQVSGKSLVVSSPPLGNLGPKVFSTGFPRQSRVLLSTALVDIEDAHGEYRKCRALIDPGSEGSFISENCMQKLGLKRHSCNIQVQGVGNTHVGTTRGYTTCKIRTKDFDLIQFKAFIMTKLTSVPSLNVSNHNWTHITNLPLADPSFYQSGQVDLILGADIYISLLKDGLVKGPPGSPSAINTKLGYLLMGEVSTTNQPSSHVRSFFITHESIQSLMEDFWNVEEVSHESISLSDEEKLCENHFIKTHSRNHSGRFCVSLPFKQSINNLGDSFHTALQRFHRLEASLTDEKRQSYNEFMREYLDLNHMQLTPTENIDLSSFPAQYYYLPHHAVYRPSSTTTKVRVVFDASCKTNSGTSLNDHLLIGPKLQVDIASLLVRFRLYQVVFTADIEKFYRQIQVSKHDCAFQRILWRFSHTEPIQSYDLCTVTYGTSCAPYLSIRCLHQLADDVHAQFPEVSKILKEDFYVDDLVSGASDIHKAKELKEQLETVLSQAGFTLRKWNSNFKELVSIPESISSQYEFKVKNSSTVKVLGLVWDPDQDVYKYSVDLPNLPQKVTKRIILSEIAKLYDPLGFLCPILTKAKILMQSTWLHCLSWDEEVPQSLSKEFLLYRSDLHHLQDLQIPRPLILFGSNVTYQLVGFCDASENAYAGVLYLKSISSSNISVRIICAKSKVSPLKKLTIPRLELCGAVLLAKMVAKFKPMLSNISQTYLFSDSTIVLAWISKPASTWKVFVSSRVSEIQTLTDSSQWYHVDSEHNPADIASRGCHVERLIREESWWSGPSWLSDVHFNYSFTSSSTFETFDVPETQKVKCALTTNQDIGDWYSKYSFFTTAVRITAQCLRFKSILQKVNISGPLSAQELENGLLCIAKHIQSVYFQEDIQNLKQKGHVSKKSKVLSLNPFIDFTGVLRVGGRVQNSQLSYDKIHQIILPLKHSFVQSIIVHYHEKYFHASIQFIMNMLRQKFWLVGNVRSSVRSVVRKCTRCIRFKGETTSPLMGSLPSARVTVTKPFHHTGCDYAGPFLIRQIGGRCKTLRKVYLAVFICMSVKAVHLELVTDLTTEAYLAALNRFVSRRGVPLHIYSDNGTTFVGADNSLTKFFRENNRVIQDQAARKSINWHFIPPSAPHMGGIWESAVKSAKHHLKRVVGEHILNFEEMNTLIIQIEAILNSRPLCKLSDDQAETQILTPSHFLIGDSLVAIPDKDTSSSHMNYNKRWQLIQKMRRDFWNRWYVEYLHTLQQRSKWKIQEENIKIGDVVLVKEDNMPPTKYVMGVVQKTCPGKDQVVRTVELKTAKGVICRPVVKLIKLPSNKEVD